MRKILFSLILIGLVAAGCDKEVVKDQHGTVINDDKPFNKDGNNYSGTITLTGYYDSASTDKAYFIFNESSSDLIYEFLGLEKLNALTGKNKVMLGCLEQDKSKIRYSYNGKQNELKDEDLKLLLESKPESRVQIRLTREEKSSTQNSTPCSTEFTALDVL
jgi:hypothetical protein